MLGAVKVGLRRFPMIGHTSSKTQSFHTFPMNTFSCSSPTSISSIKRMAELRHIEKDPFFRTAFSVQATRQSSTAFNNEVLGCKSQAERDTIDVSEIKQQ